MICLKRTINRSKQVNNVAYIEPDAKVDKQTHHDNCVNAYNYLVQSLHESQIDHVRSVHVGNAYLLMKRLKDTYGMQVSAATQASTITQLQHARRSSCESVTDCFTRVQHLINDFNAQDPTQKLPLQMQKHYYVQAFADDPKWQNLHILIAHADGRQQNVVSRKAQNVLD